MTNTFRKLFATAALLGGLSIQAAQATEPVSYPRVIGSGENAEIDYGPGPHGNIVGGGAVLTQATREGSIRITYLDNSQVQQPLPGRTPVLHEDGENSTLVYLPNAAAPRG